MAYMIWWLSGEDTDAIGSSLSETVPAYIREEYSSRRGRPGRGRLWVTPHDPAFEAVRADPIVFATPDLREHLENCGGIIIRTSDVHHVAHLRGVFTAAQRAAQAGIDAGTLAMCREALANAKPGEW